MLAVAPADLLETLVYEVYGSAVTDEFDIDLETAPVMRIDPDGLDALASGAFTLVGLDDARVTKDPTQSGAIAIPGGRADDAIDTAAQHELAVDRAGDAPRRRRARADDTAVDRESRRPRRWVGDRRRATARRRAPARATPRRDRARRDPRCGDESGDDVRRATLGRVRAVHDQRRRRVRSSRARLDARCRRRRRVSADRAIDAQGRARHAHAVDRAPRARRHDPRSPVADARPSARAASSRRRHRRAARGRLARGRRGRAHRRCGHAGRASRS